MEYFVEVWHYETNSHLHLVADTGPYSREDADLVRASMGSELDHNEFNVIVVDGRLKSEQKISTIH